MSQYNVTRIDSETGKLIMVTMEFNSDNELDFWAMAQNDEEPGSVIDAEKIEE